MTEYLNPLWGSFLAEHQYSTFDSLWDRNDEWFETPNKGRSKHGWSGVCRIEVGNRVFFLKKQENFYTYSIKKPLGISVAEKEFKNLKLFKKLNVPSMEVVYFGVRKFNGKLQAMIMTVELKDYFSLSDATAYLETQKPCLTHRRNVISRIATFLRDAHEKNVMHYSLYPKHIFISESFLKEKDESLEPLCRFIDMEKALQVKWGQKKQLRDLETLNRHSSYWSKTDRIYFLKCYLGTNKVDSELRKIVNRIKSITKK
ncbi:MAG: lipopolysaccharide kinase InaA family protein [Lentisphaeraceae bacterium]|nr:lipopolysaccharide kinase InaA family protein [Lentisphaeraceae bacterium]